MTSSTTLNMKHIVPKTLIFALLFSIVFPSEQLEAIPAFARKYRISCQVCHSPAIPQLKGFGDDFAGAGFRMTEYESPRYYVPAGDDKLSLIREFPIAVRVDGFATYNENNASRFDFASPFVFKFLSGGELSDHLSYYFYFLLNERGSIAGLEDAFIMYSDLFRTGINIYAGQFQASDPLFKSELRLTLEPYRIYEARPGNSLVALKYERGVMLDKGFSTGTTLVFEAVNGSGLQTAGEGWLFDTDNNKNFMLRLSQDIGNSLSIGAFGYTGKESLMDGTTPFTNKVRMYGPDLSVNLNEVLRLNLQYLWRTDSEILDTVSLQRKEVLTHGGFAELIFAPKGDMSNWYFTGLVNLTESDMEALQYQSATLHAGYLLRRNFRIVTEYTWNFTGSFGKVSAGFVTAF